MGIKKGDHFTKMSSFFGVAKDVNNLAEAGYKGREKVTLTF